VVEPILADLFPPRVSMERRSLFWLQALCNQDAHTSKAVHYTRPRIAST
jgi:sister-chromatid-cohesion protein PDS5